MSDRANADQTSPEGWAWVKVAPLDQLTLNQGYEVTHQGRIYALFRVGEQVFALGGLCPHQQARLAIGALDPERQTITCPRLGCLRWRFDLASGASVLGLAVACPVYPVQVAGNEVWIAVPP